MSVTIWLYHTRTAREKKFNKFVCKVWSKWNRKNDCELKCEKYVMNIVVFSELNTGSHVHI